MKSFKSPRVFLALFTALACIYANANSIDLSAFAGQHTDLITGLGLLLCTGEIQMITKALDRVEEGIQGMNTKQRELADRVLQLEQKGTAPGPNGSLSGSSFGNGGGQSLGDKFLESFQKNKDLFEKTRSVRLEIKAATDAITTTSGRNVMSFGRKTPESAVLGLQNALVSRPTANTSAVEYSRFTGIQGAAALQATEGAAKSAVRADHSLIVQTALTIAGFSKMSKQALNDSEELKRSVDATIRRSVGTALDVALCNGATGFVGGFEALATPYTSLLYQAMADAVSEGVATMQTAGFNPDVVTLNPADWLAIVVKRGTANDHYLSGNYLGAMPSEMRGLKVVLSPSVDVGKALLMDSSHSDLLVVDQFSIEVAFSGDDFTQNLVTILGEVRVIPVFRSVGSARLITPKA